MILISVHTLCGRAEIYVDDNKIKAFDVALFTGASIWSPSVWITPHMGSSH